MANAATLESLNIEISANSEKAASSVASLVHSLRSLAKGVGTVVPSLRSLNAGLKELSKYGSIKIQQIGQAAVNGSSNTTKKIKEQTTAIQERINTLVGINNVAKSAKEAGTWMDKELGKRELESRLASSTTKPTTNRKGEEVQNRPFPKAMTAAEVEAENAKFRSRGSEEYAALRERANRNKNSDTTNATSSATSALKEAASSAQTAASAISNVNTQLSNTSTISEGAGTGLNNVGSQITEAGNAGQTATSGLSEMNQELTNAESIGDGAMEALESAADGERDLGNEAENARPKVSALGNLLNRVKRIASTMYIRTGLKSLTSTFSASWSAAEAYSKKMGGSFYKSINDVEVVLSRTATTIISTLSPALSAITPVVYTIANAIQYLCTMLQSLMSMLGITSELFGTSATTINKYGNSTSKASNSAKKATDNTKNLLASWDELNVIQSTSSSSGSSGSGGSGSGSGINNKLAGAVTSEISAITSILVGEALLAVGLILACTGHIAPGIGLMALGAASIAKTLTVDWDKLPKNIQGTIAQIMAASGATFMAAGLILTLTGANLPIGLGLMAIGAASLATAVSLSWNLDETIKKKVAIIADIVGSAFLAVGAVLTFTGANLPLGIALMVAGAASLVSSIALTWNLDATIASKLAHITAIAGGALLGLGAVLAFTGASLPVGIGLMLVGAATLAGSVALTWNLDDQIKEKIAIITAYAGISLLAIGAALAFTGASLPIGIGMMLAGAATLASSVAISWNLSNQIKDELTKITVIAGASLVALGAILVLTGAGVPLGVGMMIAGGVSLAASVALNWNEIRDMITETFTSISKTITTKWEEVKAVVSAVWDVISKWWTENIAEPFKAAWTAVFTWFSEKWNALKRKISLAWTVVSKWWDSTIGEPIEGAWNTVTAFFGTLFGDSTKEGSIAKLSNDAMTSVSQWWSTTVQKPVEAAWDGVTSFFNRIFGDENAIGSISKLAADSWDSVSDWWTTNVTSNLKKEGIWGGVTGFFKGIWEGADGASGITGMASASFKTVSKWWTTNVTSNLEKEGVWGGVKGFFKGIFEGEDGNGGILGTALDAFDCVSDWWLTNVGSLIGKEEAWGTVSSFFAGLFGNNADGTGILGFFSSAWSAISCLWTTDVSSLIEAAWSAVSTWFDEHVTTPIKNAFRDALNWIIDKLNSVIGTMNDIGSFTIPGWGVTFPDWLGGGHFGWDDTPVTLWNIGTITPFASGAYDIPRGDLFIANEAGAELVGSMNGKTTVANQGQIVEGIEKGVKDANSEQNSLLSEQNSLLRQILGKSSTTTVSPSLAWSRFNNSNQVIYERTTGR